MAESFFMVSLELKVRRLAQLGNARGLPLSRVDDGYLVHTALGELFGDMAPRPFAIRGHRRGALTILGYSDGSAECLRQRADALAEPAVHNCCDWDTLACKAMPETWPVDAAFRFSLRVCPIVRRSGRGPNGERPGREMDAYLAYVERHPEAGQSRSQVYVEWLKAALERKGGAEVEHAAVTGFSLRVFLRRDHQRKPRNVPVKPHSRSQASGRPDVTVEGRLRVSETRAFGDLLRRGIGRHRAFGFGMLLLRGSG